MQNNIEEKKILLYVVEKGGLIKIFNYLSISPLNKENPTEKAIDNIIENLGLLRTTILLLQILFDIF